MKHLVVDASVVVKLFFEEEYSQSAERIVASAEELLAPDLIWAETANVIWKRHRNGEISPEDAAAIGAQIAALPLNIHDSGGLIADALDLAMQTGRTVYDCLYLAVAVKTGSILATGDRRLANALAGGPMEAFVAWIGREVP
ncbi:MAG: type II toxin-antitoxin system VapC family toxin [Planctomycetota bacterium]|nr:type II toxin-antitoxin system VapC family toxin [Planctomycetota bacterium]